MEASDLLGSLRPSPKATSNMQFEFVNGVVIEAMLKGGILLIDEINTAEDSVLERLNQVL
jgi:midasin (ATPase involved in ribosome maturation)